jgi:hypothetical protein
VGAEGAAMERARKALRLRCLEPSDHDEPFAAIILCASDPEKVDKRTRSKWSRVLRYAIEYKPSCEPLAAFIQGKVSPFVPIPLMSVGCYFRGAGAAFAMPHIPQREGENNYRMIYSEVSLSVPC